MRPRPGTVCRSRQDVDPARSQHWSGRWPSDPAVSRKTDVTILDVYENAASVKIVTGDFVDDLHLTRWNGEWKILHVLTEMHPAPVK